VHEQPTLPAIMIGKQCLQRVNKAL